LMKIKKTELITDGIYKISRNPYFLSYESLAKLLKTA
jgi:protein-S-isoprenylcysteine O-methyltransferase Ste14